MESTKRALKFQFNESKFSIFKFWVVILIVDLFAVFMTKYTSVSIGINEGGGGQLFSLFGMNILPIIIYLMVYNYELYYKNFSIALSFSVIRKEFFISMIANNVIVAFVFAVIQSILMKVDPMLVRFVGRTPIYDFKAFNIQTDSVIFIILYLFIAFMLYITIWNLIAVLNYKYGPKFWIALVTIALLPQFIIKTNLLSDFILPGDWLNLRITPLLFTVFSIITILIYTVIYFIIQNTNVKNKA
jgi:hypothetical protein